MLATDGENSVVSEVSMQQHQRIAYSAYGYDQGGGSHLGYNGELRDSFTGKYFLGSGKRLFNTCLLRFESPDGAY